ncbi:hypothetical protein LTR36_009859 [Oleoguttula mirabilis]|uniref:Thioesterase domain-containing protein n=1 Tax=Oleoguttula mirabilis TaxID=1507867 RepID=A0AAV9J4Z5_9PEZI|nr:hypothetical protein LTR36_009859 [Oleoguttula mirabilis]
MATPNPQTDEEARALMHRLIKTYSAASPRDNFDNAFNRAAACTAASLETATTAAKATVAFTIPPGLYGNNPASPTGASSVHGGAIATFFDNSTSLPMLAVLPGKRWAGGFSGVTRNLSVTYFRPAHAGEAVVIEAEVVQCGKRNATISGVLRRVRDGVVLAMCRHDKVRLEGGEGFKL